MPLQSRNEGADNARLTHCHASWDAVQDAQACPEAAAHRASLPKPRECSFRPRFHIFGSQLRRHPPAMRSDIPGRVVALAPRQSCDANRGASEQPKTTFCWWFCSSKSQSPRLRACRLHATRARLGKMNMLASAAACEAEPAGVTTDTTARTRAVSPGRPAGACHKCGAQVKDASRVRLCNGCGCRCVHCGALPGTTRRPPFPVNRAAFPRPPRLTRARPHTPQLPRVRLWEPHVCLRP